MKNSPTFELVPVQSGSCRLEIWKPEPEKNPLHIGVVDQPITLEGMESKVISDANGTKATVTNFNKNTITLTCSGIVFHVKIM